MKGQAQGSSFLLFFFFFFFVFSSFLFLFLRFSLIFFSFLFLLTSFLSLFDPFADQTQQPSLPFFFFFLLLPLLSFDVSIEYVSITDSLLFFFSFVEEKNKTKQKNTKFLFYPQRAKSLTLQPRNHLISGPFRRNL